MYSETFCIIKDKLNILLYEEKQQCVKTLGLKML